jgi:hypothetical protein
VRVGLRPIADISSAAKVRLMTTDWLELLVFWWPAWALPIGFFLAQLRPPWWRRCCFAVVSMMPLVLLMTLRALNHCKPFGPNECYFSVLGLALEVAVFWGLVALILANAAAWARRRFGPSR